MTDGAASRVLWRIPVTGAGGFAGRAPLAAMGRFSPSAARTVAGLPSRKEAGFSDRETIDLDIGDPGSVERAVREARPTHLGRPGSAAGERKSREDLARRFPGLPPSDGGGAAPRSRLPRPLCKLGARLAGSLPTARS